VPPWGQELIGAIVGPFGAIVVLSAALFFLWRLYREEQREGRETVRTVATLAEAMKDLTAELKIWREAGGRK
jgi:hypothetical protein